MESAQMSDISFRKDECTANRRPACHFLAKNHPRRMDRGDMCKIVSRVTEATWYKYSRSTALSLPLDVMKDED